MDKINSRPKNVEDYIRSFSKPVQKKLRQIQKSVKKTAPEAEEVISYQMPAYKYHGILLYFAAWKNHIGFYCYPSAVLHFKSEISDYVISKSTIQFPHDRPLPLDLIERIIRFRLEEKRIKAETKLKKNRVKKSVDELK